MDYAWDNCGMCMGCVRDAHGGGICSRCVQHAWNMHGICVICIEYVWDVYGTCLVCVRTVYV